jgi:hypothetical protein
MKVAIQRISLASLSKMGCLLGAVAALLPSFLCGLLGVGLARLLRNWLEGWQEVVITLFGREVARFDLLHFLGLENALDVLQSLTAASGAVLFLAVVALALISGLVLATIVVLVGLTYNLVARGTGGLVVEMRQVQAKHLELDQSRQI